MRTTQLNGILPLGDIRNVEKVCQTILMQAMRTRRVRISPTDEEEALAFLIGEAWVLWRRYDAEHPAGAKFSSYAIPQLRFRVLDWWKKKLGRGASPGEWGLAHLEALDDDELERVLGQGGGDDPSDRFSDLGRLLAPRGGEASRHAAA